MRDRTFGTYGDAINLKTQYAACTGNKVKLVAVSNNASAGLFKGVMDVNIKRDVSGIYSDTLIDIISKKLMVQLGGLSSLEGVSDIIMYCMPPGVGFNGGSGELFLIFI